MTEINLAQALPQKATITAGTELPCDLVLDVRLIAGRYEVTRLQARQRRDGPPIDADTLRALPIRRTIQRHLAHLIEPHRGTPDRGDLEQVARVYALAYAVGMRPTKAVATHLGIPQSSASKKVLAARQAGLLPQASPGSATSARPDVVSRP